MRKTFGLTAMVLAAFVACGSDESTNQPLADAGPGSDGGVRPEDGAAGEADAADSGALVRRGFEIQSKDVTILAGQEITYCYHFTTPNTEAIAINKWKSVMPPSVRFMALYIGGTQEESGTLSTACPTIAKAEASDLPMWAYASYKAESELAFPSDDGTGKPLGLELPPGKRAFLLMYHVNATSEPTTAHVTLNAEALPEGAAFTKTSTFVTYNGDISIPGLSTNYVASKTCATLPDTKFWSMSMHAHKQAVRTIVKNGTSASTSIVYESTDWANPPQKTWSANPFFTFDQEKLTYECTYTNPTDRTITDGDEFATDETCMATGYYFPATEPVTCFCPDGTSNCLHL